MCWRISSPKAHRQGSRPRSMRWGICSSSPLLSCSLGGCITACSKCGNPPNRSRPSRSTDGGRFLSICSAWPSSSSRSSTRSIKISPARRPVGLPSGRSAGENDAMSDLTIGGLGFGALFVLIALRVPIGVAMLSVGMVGYFSIAGAVSLLSFLKTEMYWRFSSFDFSVIPLFLMMGNFATRAGVTTALFRAASAFIGHFRGGLAMAAIGGCAAFGTISGSSLATAAMMGQVSLPELRKYKYSGSFATGALAAGGTLGALIPPSIPLIIYAIMVEGNIIQLFQAAFVPGILAAIGYLIVISIVVRINPAAGPAGDRASMRERLLALRDVWTVALVFLVV